MAQDILAWHLTDTRLVHRLTGDPDVYVTPTTRIHGSSGCTARRGRGAGSRARSDPHGLLGGAPCVVARAARAKARRGGDTVVPETGGARRKRRDNHLSARCHGRSLRRDRPEVAGPDGTAGQDSGGARRAARRHRRRALARPSGSMENSPSVARGCATSTGQQIQLRGMSTHGIQWYPPMRQRGLPRRARQRLEGRRHAHLDVHPGRRL